MTQIADYAPHPVPLDPCEVPEQDLGLGVQAIDLLSFLLAIGGSFLVIDNAVNKLLPPGCLLVDNSMHLEEVAYWVSVDLGS